jgi:hypothetical protein
VTREGHTTRWREYLLQIGGTIDEVPGVLRSYYPRTRKRAKVVARLHAGRLAKGGAEVTVYDGQGEAVWAQ